MTGSVLSDLKSADLSGPLNVGCGVYMYDFPKARLLPSLCLARDIVILPSTSARYTSLKVHKESHKYGWIAVRRSFVRSLSPTRLGLVDMATVPTEAELQHERAHYNETQVPALLASNILFLNLATMAVALRFLCRWMSRIKYQYDDWFIVAGLVSASITPCSQAVSLI